MLELTGTAKRAREVALERHRTELAALQAQIHEREGVIRELYRLNSEYSRVADTHLLEKHQAEWENKASIANWKWSFRVCCTLLVIMTIGVCVLAIHNPIDTWRTDVPPVEQKLKVVTHAWYHRTKGWCSYETGEPITVTQWQPK